MTASESRKPPCLCREAENSYEFTLPRQALIALYPRGNLLSPAVICCILSQETLSVNCILSYDMLPVSLSVPAGQSLKKCAFFIIAPLSFRLLYGHMEHMIKRVLRGSEDVKF